MASSERVEKLIAGWQRAQATRKQAETSRDLVRGYDTRHGRHGIAPERAAEEARAAASLATRVLSEDKKPDSARVTD